MGRTACTEPLCLYKGALYLYFLLHSECTHITPQDFTHNWVPSWLLEVDIPPVKLWSP